MMCLKHCGCLTSLTSQSQQQQQWQGQQGELNSQDRHQAPLQLQQHLALGHRLLRHTCCSQVQAHRDTTASAGPAQVILLLVVVVLVVLVELASTLKLLPLLPLLRLPQRLQVALEAAAAAAAAAPPMASVSVPRT
jgi:hypothetical protein